MFLWRQLTRGARSLFNQRRTNDEIATEIRQYLEDATAAGIARGLSRDGIAILALGGALDVVGQDRHASLHA